MNKHKPDAPGLVRAEIRHGPPEATQLPSPWAPPKPALAKDIDEIKDTLSKLSELVREQQKTKPLNRSTSQPDSQSRPDSQSDSQPDSQPPTKPDKDGALAEIDRRTAGGKEEVRAVCQEIYARYGYKKWPTLEKAHSRWRVKVLEEVRAKAKSAKSANSLTPSARLIPASGRNGGRRPVCR
jgi:hypothetical protein